MTYVCEVTLADGRTITIIENSTMEALLTAQHQGLHPLKVRVVNSYPTNDGEGEETV